MSDEISLAQDIAVRLRKKQYHVEIKEDKIKAENQTFLLGAEYQEFSRTKQGYLLPADFGAEILTAFILHILEEKKYHQYEAVKFVRSIGIRPNLHGYHFLVTAICQGLENPAHCFSVTDNIYPAIAEKYCVDIRCVERNIRSAVNDAYKNNREQLLKPFYYTVEKPYDSELIALAVELIRYHDIAEK